MQYPNKALPELFALYVQLGWRIFPLHGIQTDGTCTCGNTNCENKGKHPRIKDWPNMASSNPTQIMEWLCKFPDANWGLACGKESGIVALDVDPRHGGDESLKELEQVVGEEFETVINLTGGGGQHFLFSYPENQVIRNAVKIKGIYDGLDIRADRGYIVIPPSRHKSGQAYEWDVLHSPEDTKPSLLPQKLQELLTECEGLQYVQVPEEDWANLPLEVARQLSDVCPWLRGVLNNQESADSVSYDQWVGTATWAHALYGSDSTLFHEWSKTYSNYRAKETETKWKGTAQLSPYSCKRMDCGYYGLCSISEKNPVTHLRIEYGKQLGLDYPFGRPSNVEKIKRIVEQEGVDWLKEHTIELIDARATEAALYQAWMAELATAGSEAYDLVYKIDQEVEEDLIGIQELITSVTKANPDLHLAVDNTDRIAILRKKIEELIGKMKIGEDPVMILEQAIPLLAELYTVESGKAKIYAYALVDANKGRIITKTTIMENIAEEIKKHENKWQGNNNTTQSQSFDTNQGFRLDLARDWAKTNELHFVYYDDKGTPHLQESRMAKTLIKDFHIHFIFGGLYAYNGKYYENKDDELPGFILEALETITPSWGKASFVDSILRTLEQLTRSRDGTDGNRWYDMWDAEPYIVFQNGVLDMTDPLWPLLVEFSPKYRCTWMVQCEWSLWSKSEDVDKYLESTLPDPETRKSLLEYLGYSIARFDASNQRYALLYGSGRNGKGLFMNVLESLFSGAYATTSLKDLSDNRFASVRIRNAAVNIVGDMSGERLQDTEILKRITGNDTIDAEQKYKDRFSFKPRVKMWFAINELPSTPDASYGFFRRQLIFPFNQRFDGNKADQTLVQKIRTPEALSYWAKIAIDAYGFMKQKGTLTESEEMKQAVKTYWSANDIVQMALEDGIIEFGEEFTIPRKLLHLAFELYADEWGRKAPSTSKLLERIQNANPNGKINVFRPTETDQYGTQRPWLWKGIRLGEAGFQLSKTREYIDQDTKELCVAVVTIEDLYKEMQRKSKTK